MSYYPYTTYNPMLKLYNSITHKLEIFKPIQDNQVGLYTCGPTVYNYVHIGNLRTYIFKDVLRRVLVYNGYKVNHVMNITDVGHLTSDADEGEDKLEKGAQREGKTVWEIADFYTKKFLEDIEALNILKADKLVKATDHITEQIEIVKILMDKGYAYDTPEAVYFDTNKFPNYSKLSGQKLEEKIVGARKEVVTKTAKKNPADFALWFKLVGKFKNHSMHWPSPWGEGFPGWHIECSAMSTKYLGQPFDIHTGGVDNIFPHHTNEIAQSEAAFEKPLANYWLHGEFLLINEGRMGKSEGNFIILKDIIEHDYNPLSFRYLVLTSHYRSKLNFTWESLDAAQNALHNLYEEISAYEEPKVGCAEYEQNFLEAVNDDLDTPKALAVVWDLIRSDYPGHAKLQSLLKFDQVLGLKLKQVWEESKAIPDVVRRFIGEREEARRAKDFHKADELRKKVEAEGFIIEDLETGPRVKKKF